MATRKTTSTNGTASNGTSTRSTATASTAPKKASPRTTATRSARSVVNTAQSTLHLTPEQRHQWICTAAYYMAEHSGFQGNPVEFWLCAEAQVDGQLHA